MRSFGHRGGMQQGHNGSSLYRSVISSSRRRQQRPERPGLLPVDLISLSVSSLSRRQRQPCCFLLHPLLLCLLSLRAAPRFWPVHAASVSGRERLNHILRPECLCAAGRYHSTLANLRTSSSPSVKRSCHAALNALRSSHLRIARQSVHPSRQPIIVGANNHPNIDAFTSPHSSL